MIKKRETPLENIAFISIVSAINIIFILLLSFLPIVGAFIAIILPLTSLVVYEFCKKRYFAIYGVAIILLCVVFNFWKLTDTLVYTVSGLLTALVLGIAIDYKFPMFLAIMIASIVNIGVTYASLPLIKLFVEINTIDYFFKFFKLEGFAYKDYLPAIFILVLSSMQMVLTYLVVSEEGRKFGIETSDNRVDERLLFGISLLLFALMMAFVFIYGPLAFIFFGLLIYIAMYDVISSLYENKNRYWIALAINIVIQVFLYAILNPYIHSPNNIFIISYIFIAEVIFTFSNYCLEKMHNKDRIK